MYVLNPSEAMLNSWYKCKYKEGIYLSEHGLPMIYKDEKYYYFAKTEKLYSIIKIIPLYIKALFYFGL